MLKKLSEHQIGLNLLFNANCYGKDSQSRAFFNKVGMTVDYIQSSFGLQSITTTSPLIAKFIKNNFENITVRASVNMEIGTIQGMDYLAQYFDGYYMKREWNRDFEKIRELSAWCRENGKKLHMLANSGCLNHCSAHNFHDNLVAHEQEISQMDNAYNFGGICKEYLKEESHYLSLIHDTNFVRPEDIGKYEPYFEVIEDEGYEAFVYRNTGARGVVSDMDGSPGNTLSPEEQIEVNENAKTATAHHRSVQFTRPAREGSVAPDLQFQFRLAAVACGLGEIGWSKMLLTPEFGPLQRVAFLFTDAELEYDEMYNGKPLCRKCGACVRQCPGGCIPAINSGKPFRNISPAG